MWMVGCVVYKYGVRAVLWLGEVVWGVCGFWVSGVGVGDGDGDGGVKER